MILRDRSTIRQQIEELLKEKGYVRDDYEVEHRLKIDVDGQEAELVLDILIALKDKYFLAIRCAPGSTVSREVDIISMARIFAPYIIPYCLITNGDEGELIDSITGKVIGGLQEIPQKTEALDEIESIQLQCLSDKKRKQAKRILLASETIKCPLECET